MSAQNTKKGLVSFLFLSMLLALATCSSSTNSPKDEPSVTPSSDSRSSSSSEVVISSSSEIESSSSSEEADSSSSEVADSSSSEVVESSSSEAVISSSSAAASSSSRAASSSSVAAVSSSSRAASSSSVAASSSSRAASSSSVAATSSSSQASTPITTRSWTNVDYAPNASRRHSRQRYDIDLPSSGNGPFPLLIYVHGGGFSGGDWQLNKNKNGLVSLANSSGYAVASVGYLLMGQNGGSQKAFPENVEDVLAAIRHLRANASTYHIDPDKFAVSGFSAGAYMTAIVCALSNATNHGYDITSLGNAGVSHAVQAAASSAALTDFSLLNTHQNQNTGITYFLDHDATPEGAMLGGNLKNDKDKEPMKTYLKQQNPLTHISANTPPIYMMHGTNDNLVPWQQSKIMVDKINSFVTNKATFKQVPGRDHKDFDSVNATDSKTTEILNFLDKALGITR